MKKLNAVLLAVAMLVTLLTTSFAIENTQSESPKAQTLQISDAVEILKSCVGLSSIYDEAEIKPTIEDAVEILKCVVGLSVLIEEPTSETPEITTATTFYHGQRLVPGPPDGTLLVEIDPLCLSQHIAIDYRFIERYGNHLSRKTITSNQELNDYIENILNLEPIEKVNSPSSEHMNDLLAVYDNDFFEDYIIVTLAYSQRSGARPIIRNLETDGEEIYITVYRPYANAPSQPCLMSQGFYFIKIDRQYYEGNNIGIKVFTNN